MTAFHLRQDDTVSAYAAVDGRRLARDFGEPFDLKQTTLKLLRTFMSVCVAKPQHAVTERILSSIRTPGEKTRPGKRCCDPLGRANADSDFPGEF